MKDLYKASAVATGGRDGQVRIENTPIWFEMALPSELGGKKGNGFNPEQLFAAGYAACFGSAIAHFVKLKRLDIAPPDVHAHVGIGKNEEGGFALSVELEVVFKGIDQDTAESITQQAHKICPYSNATRGNVDVNVLARVE